MTNEELAIEIKAGKTDLYSELWSRNEPLIRWLAEKFWYDHGDAAAPLEDLEQAGFFGLTDAVRYYDPAKKFAFTSYLTLTAKRAFNDACGFRTGRSDAMHRAESLETPLGGSGDEEDALTVEDTLEDKPASEAFENVSEQAFTECLRRTLRLALAELEPAERAFLFRRFYMGEQRRDAERYLVERYGIPAESVRSCTARIFPKLRSGSYRRQLRELLDELVGTSYDTGAGSMTGGGLETFRRTGFSSTESAALGRIARETGKK